MPDTEFIMIRHGQTGANQRGLLQGHTDTELDETGLLQVRAVAARLRREGKTFVAIYSSDLRRALVTAQILAEAVNGTVIPLTALREWNLGRLENRPTLELRREYPRIMDAFQYEFEDVAVPGGESRAEFNRRVADCLDTLACRHAGQRLLLVTHFGVVRAMFRHVVGPASESVLLPLLNNAAICRFFYRDGCWNWPVGTIFPICRESRFETVLFFKGLK